MAGADVCASTELVSQLLDAASRGNMQRIATLLEQHQGENLHASSADYGNLTALHLAAFEGLLAFEAFTRFDMC